jgi:hypothetical protein
MTTIEKIKKLTEHIGFVRMNCEKLGMKLIELGDEATGIELIARGHRHDNSKFYRTEWEYLWPDTPSDKFREAHDWHVKLNDHHPECHYGIHKMSKAALAEMVCDWKSRATETGTCLMDWIDTKALERFKFTKQDQVYEDIVHFVNLLCEKPFAVIK